jgi:hypothetical protein
MVDVEEVFFHPNWAGAFIVCLHHFVLLFTNF